MNLQHLTLHFHDLSFKIFRDKFRGGAVVINRVCDVPEVSDEKNLSRYLRLKVGLSALFGYKHFTKRCIIIR